MPMDNKGTNPLRDVSLLGRLYKVLHDLRPDLPINYPIKPVIYGALAARSTSVKVISVVPGLGNVFLKRNLFTRFVELLYRISQLNVHTVFFLNNDDYELFEERKLVPVAKMAVLPGEGIDIQYFSPSPPRLSNTKIRFLLSARMLWDKGVGEFVEAAEIVRRSYPNTEFALLGFLDVQNPSAIGHGQIDDWVARGIVDYFGATADVRPFISDADVIVLPSSYKEGLSRSLLEAAAMGKPIITSDITGCRDVVDDGVTGFLCEPKDSASLVLQMERMLALSQVQRQAMGQAAREKMVSQFDEALVIDRYRNTLEAIFA